MLISPAGRATMRGAPKREEADRGLKVCLIVEATSGGVGRHVIDLTRGLAELGNQVHLVVSPVRMSQAFSEQLRELSEKGLVSHTVASMGRAPSPGDLACAAKVRAVIRNGGHDVVHLHSTKAGLVGRMAGLGLGRACVYTPHAPFSLDASRPKHLRIAAGWLERALSIMTDGIVAVSEEEQAHLLSLGVPAKKIWVIHNGIDIAAFRQSLPARDAARASLSVRPGQVCVGFVGRFDRQKNPELALRSFARVRERRIEAVMVLAGWGELKRPLQELASSLGLDPWVRWLGPEEAPRVFAAADAFALTSRYEGMPYVLLEASSAGLAVVTTRIGGASLLVRHGDSGVIVDGDDVEAFAEGLATVTENPDRCRAFGIRGERNACRFTQEFMVEQTIGLYRTILQQKGSTFTWPTAP